MNRSISAAAMALLLVSAPARAQDAFEVVRAGDGQMTCEALISEINSLNQAVRAREAAAQRSAATRQAAGRFGRGLLSGLAQGAGALGGSNVFGIGSNPMAGMVASAAVSGVASELANGQPAGAAAPQPATPAPQTSEQQRLAHLNGLLVNRGC